jgi:translation initiation factor eIF-2B subunit delta
MAPVQNLVAQAVYDVNHFQEDGLVSVQKFALSRTTELCKQSETAVQKSAECAAAIIEDYDCLVTCSYSSTVCETFKVAKQQGKRFKVYVAESRSDDGMFRYGKVLSDFLNSINVTAEVFPDNEIRRFVPKTECAIVGADSVLSGGSIINGAPTYELAVVAKEHGLSFYSVCETTKANILSYLDKNVELKKGFDLVPSNLITGIVTENGILGVTEIVEVMRKKSKFYEIFHAI